LLRRRSAAAAPGPDNALIQLFEKKRKKKNLFLRK
jgi:hypothetical protein